MLFDTVICFDHYKQKIILITGVSTKNVENFYKEAELRLIEIKELLKKGIEKESSSLILHEDLRFESTKEEFIQMVDYAKRYIHEGDIFQVVLSNPIRAKATGSLLDTFRVLRASNPSPYMFYFSSEDIEMAGASPETLVKLDEKNYSHFLWQELLKEERQKKKTIDLKKNY